MDKEGFGGRLHYTCVQQQRMEHPYGDILDFRVLHDSERLFHHGLGVGPVALLEYFVKVLQEILLFLFLHLFQFGLVESPQGGGQESPRGLGWSSQHLALHQSSSSLPDVLPVASSV